jgi:flagellum-specific peptidoglycan hydrolase FlgJ
MKKFMKTNTLVALMGLLSLTSVMAQPSPITTEEEVIELLKQRCNRDASFIQLMVREAGVLKRVYDLPIQVTLAIAIVESKATQSDLALKANNLFGLTCSFDWPDDRPVFYKYHDGQQTCFRVFPSYAESFKGFADFIMSRDRHWYEDARNCSWDADCWIDGLSEYAVDPEWGDKLKAAIRNYRLYVFDND